MLAGGARHYMRVRIPSITLTLSGANFCEMRGDGDIHPN